MNKLKTLLSTLFVMLMVGCALSNSWQIAAGQSSAIGFDKNNGNGLALISFDDRNLFGSSGMGLKIKDSSGKNFLLTSSIYDEKVNDTSPSRISFSARELVPGKYEVQKWALYRTESGESAPYPKDPIYFTIRPGEVIYIGDFKVVRFTGNGIFTDQFERDKVKFLKYFPFLTGVKITNNAIKSDIWPQSGTK